MKVEAVTKYVYKGVEYKSLKEIQDVIHNTIGVEVIDKINRVCPPQQHKHLFKLLEVLCQPDVRKVLTECLNVTFEKEHEEWGDLGQSETINVLDLK
jgi:hypothetical protein